VVSVLFDLDGTLTDPFEGITRCHQHALEQLGVHPVPTQRELARFIGPPLRRTFATLLGDAATAADIERAVAVFRERFSTLGMYENEVYPGVEPMLTELRARGCTLYVATSKVGVYAKRILEHFGLDAFFAGVYGSELDGRLDDKADLLRHLCIERPLRDSDAVMIGDREHDVLAAKRNGLRSIGVTWGYGSVEELTAAGADALCSRPADLVPALLGSALV